MSHDLGVIAQMCDRVVVMKDGAVIETGPIRQVLHQPQQPYTQRLIASQPSLLKPSTKEICPDRPPHLSIRNLDVSFRSGQGIVGWALRKPPHEVKAVSNVSLTLPRGGSLGIVGESGSGKSTIARAVIGLVQAQGGRIEIGGQQLPPLLARRTPEQLRKLQMVFQDPFMSLNPAFTVARTLEEPLRQHKLCPTGEIPARIADLMTKVELPTALLERRTTQLSGGQRQRVGIARALALEPEILIADEVTSALDVTIQAQILGLFERLRRDLSLTLILISHDLAVVRYLCEKVAVMRNGHLVEYGDTSDVLRAPKEGYTRDLIAAIPHLPDFATDPHPTGALPLS